MYDMNSLNMVLCTLNVYFLSIEYLIYHFYVLALAVRIQSQLQLLMDMSNIEIIAMGLIVATRRATRPEGFLKHLATF